MASRSVELLLCVSGQDSQADEYTLAYAGSLAELLLQQGVRVGLSGPGVALKPGSGQRQIQQVLYVLARLKLADPFVASHGDGSMARIALCSPGRSAPPECAHVIYPQALERAA